MKIQFLHELVDYLHGDRPYAVRSFIMEQIAKTVDNNKGHFWETKKSEYVGGTIFSNYKS